MAMVRGNTQGITTYHTNIPTEANEFPATITITLMPDSSGSALVNIPVLKDVLVII